MEYEEFKRHYSFMYVAHVSAASSYFFSKSEEWVKENVPIIAYEEPIYNFIRTTGTCVSLTEEVMVYEVNGQWQRIAIKK